MNTNMTGLRCFQAPMCPCALYECSLSIRRVNTELFPKVLEYQTNCEVPSFTIAGLVKERKIGGTFN